MRYILAGIFSLFAVYCSATTDEFRFGPEDVIGMYVWGEPELTRSNNTENGEEESGLVVRPDGRATFPLVGDIYVARKTVDQVTKEVTEGLKKYVSNPVVTLTIEEVNSNVVYVIGGVTAPGAYTSGSPLTALRAISLAGGRSDFGGDDIVVLRRLFQDNNATNVAVFRRNFNKLARNKESDIPLLGGDTVIVEGTSGNVARPGE